MKPEKQKLLEDLLNSESRSDAIFTAGVHILRRRRHWRSARRGIGLALVLTAAMFWLDRHAARLPAPQTPSLVAKTSGPAQLKSLTDDELLALFPNTPVGLATLADGRKLLLFPRPGDEAKYVGRL